MTNVRNRIAPRTIIEERLYRIGLNYDRRSVYHFVGLGYWIAPAYFSITLASNARNKSNKKPCLQVSIRDGADTHAYRMSLNIELTSANMWNHVKEHLKLRNIWYTQPIHRVGANGKIPYIERLSRPTGGTQFLYLSSVVPRKHTYYGFAKDETKMEPMREACVSKTLKTITDWKMSCEIANDTLYTLLQEPPRLLKEEDV